MKTAKETCEELKNKKLYFGQLEYELSKNGKYSEFIWFNAHTDEYQEITNILRSPNQRNFLRKKGYKVKVSGFWIFKFVSVSTCCGDK